MTTTAEDPDLRDTLLEDAELNRRLAATWNTASGIWGALSTVDHKIIGRRYIVTAFVFLALGGVLAIAMRLQLAQPEARLIGPDRYNQIFTMHGANMMFLFAVPVMEAIAVYLVPSWSARAISRSRVSMRFPIGSILREDCCFGWPLQSTQVLTSAGLPMCLFQGQNMGRESEPTSGLR